jgi:hypothetical protein
LARGCWHDWPNTQASNLKICNAYSIRLSTKEAKMPMSIDAKAIFPHPTQTELCGELARRLLNRLRRTAKK